MRITGLSLVPIYVGQRLGLLESLTARLGEIFALPVSVHHPWFDPESAFDASRSQYHSTRLLLSLLAAPGAGRAGKILGVTEVDLFVPVLTYVFGEAELGGRAAIVSLHRLRPEAYGLPEDPALLGERLLKEAVHELGHTLGLIHCPDPQCVMRPATYTEEIDLKSAGFCPRCSAIALGRPAEAPLSHPETIHLPSQSPRPSSRSGLHRRLLPADK